MDGCPHLLHPLPRPPEGGVAGVPGGGQAIKTVSLQSLQPLSLNPHHPPPPLLYRDRRLANEMTVSGEHVTVSGPMRACGV